MGKVAFVFPGQGAQAVGMGRDVYDSHAGARTVFQRADEVLEYALTDLIFNGPEESLRMTYNTQPALLAASMAFYEAFKTCGVNPDFVAGHSLGEYSALVVAGVLSYDDALRLVRLRGQLMDEAVPAGQGGMAAVLGAEREALSALCRQISAEVGLVELANVNCPGQIVVSGTKEGVEAVVQRGKEAGAKRVVPLEVSGPFHSSLMEPAARKLSPFLDDVPFRDASIPVVANVTARPVTEADAIRQLLVRQIYSPVLWEDSIRWLCEQGVDTFYEIGSGTVLAGLIKKIDRSATVYSVNSREALEKVMATGETP